MTYAFFTAGRARNMARPAFACWRGFSNEFRTGKFGRRAAFGVIWLGGHPWAESAPETKFNALLSFRLE